MVKKHTVCVWLLLSILLTVSQMLYAQQTLTLEDCRTRAIEGNKQIQIKLAEQKLAKETRQSTRMLYLPKLNLQGAYLRTNEELSLLNDDQKAMFGNMGTSLSGTLQQNVPNLITSLAQQGIITPAQAQGLAQMAGQSLPQLQQSLNQLGEEVVDAFRTDSRNLMVGSVNLTQPLYTGGKISAANKMADLNEELSATQIELTEDELVKKTDEAYWLVVSLRHKERLAASYRDLLQHLDEDVQKMIREGVATKADGLSVSVKLNEAEMTLTQVENGLVLSRMALCQLCGMPVDSQITLVDEQKEDLEDSGETPVASIEQVWENRPELKILRTARQITDQKVRMAKADYIPTLALTAGYTLTNPNLLNGFQKRFGGIWHVGALLSMPLSNIWENRPKVAAARTQGNIYDLKREDAESLIGLQVRQNEFRLSESRKKLKMTEKNIASADENLRSANLGFSEGVFTATTVMEAQTAWLKAKSQQIDAQIDVRLAISELSKSMGL